MTSRSASAAAASAAITVALVMAAMVAAQAPLAKGPSAAAPSPITTPQPTAVSFPTPEPTPTTVIVSVSMTTTTPTPSAMEPVGPHSTPNAMPGGEAPPPMEPGRPYSTPTPSAMPMASPVPPTSPGAMPMPSSAPGAAPVISAAPTAATSPVDSLDPSGARAPSILSFWVVNATSGEWLFPLTPSSVLEPAVLGFYSIAAVPSTSDIGGVVYTQPAKYAHTEATAPYVLGWNVDGVTRPVFLTPGVHTVAAYVEMPGGGRGPSSSVTFEVIFPPVMDFWVVDADASRPTNGQRLFRLLNNTVLDIATVGQWSIEAEYGPGDGLSVRFIEPPQYAHLEKGERPMMMAPTSPGLVWPAKLPMGRHTVAAHAEDWRGERGPAKVVSFVVDDSESN